MVRKFTQERPVLSTEVCVVNAASTCNTVYYTVQVAMYVYIYIYIFLPGKFVLSYECLNDKGMLRVAR